MVTDLRYLAPLGLSDDCLLDLKYNIGTLKAAEDVPKYRFCQGNYDRIREEMRLDWDGEFAECTVTLMKSIEY